ncbi:hypothetical protein WME91_19435 [Sorangium sp. So ce269]
MTHRSSSERRWIHSLGIAAALLSAARPAAAQPAGPSPTAAAPASTAPPPGEAAPRAAVAQATARPPPANSAASPAAAATAGGESALALRIGGGAIVWYYQPFLSGYKPNLQLAFVALRIKATYGRFGIYVHPRFRDTKAAPFFEGPSWIEEAYAWADLGTGEAPLTLKIGKIYNQLGLFWDNSFYGNIQMFDGLKLAPEHGLSLEGRYGAQDKAGVRYTAQFFPVDGRTNLSSQDRDTVSIPGARRRYQAILRSEPFVQLDGAASLKAGVSAEYLQADLPSGPKDVFRGALDTTLTIGKWGLWGEFLYQRGQTVTDFPYAGEPATDTAPAVPGRASARNYYVLAGTEYTYGRVTARYNFSYGRYADQAVSERIHEPAVGVALTENLGVLTELVLWERSAPEGHSLVDRSLAISLNGRFSHLVTGKE